MSYYLLAIEFLLACILFTAIMKTVGMRRKRRFARILIYLVAILVPLIPLGGFLAFALGMRFAAQIHQSPILLWAVALFVAYVAGVIGIDVFAGRRDGAGMRAGLSWPIRRLAASLAVALALMAMTYWNLDLRARIDIQALRAQAGSLALTVIPPQVADSANAAPLYQQVNDRYRAASIPADNELDYKTLDVHTPEFISFLQRQQMTLEILRRAADLPDCRPDLDYLKPDMTAMLNLLGPYRNAANLLYAAARAEAADGHADLALQDCRRIYAIGGHAGAAPLLVSGLVTLAIDDLASESAVQVLPFVTKKEQLDPFTSPDPAAVARGFVRALRGDEVYGLASFCDMAIGKAGMTVDGIPGNRGFPGSIAAWLLWMQYEVGPYQEFVNRLEQVSVQPYYQSAAERKSLVEDSEPPKRKSMMVSILVPSIVHVLTNLANTQARLSVAQVAIAATRYRLDHNEYPATAELLAPYLETMPLDPFDGKSLRLKKSADGSLTIYSIGEDGIDNGGDVVRTETKKPTDVGAILRNPSAPVVATRPAP